MPRGTQNSRGASGGGSIRKKIVKRNGKEYLYWEARYTSGYDPKTGKQKQHSITGRTQKEVAQKLRQVTSELDQGTYKEPCKLTLSEWLDIWTKEYTGNLKPRTLEAYQCQIENHIRPELGNLRLEHLTPHAIQHFYNSCIKNGLSPKSTKNIHGILHKALQQAVAVGYLATNPTASCTLPRAERKPITPMDDNIIRDFTAAVQGHPFEIIFLVTLFTGMRRGEVFGLTWDCVDFGKGTLLINKQLQKTKEGGTTKYNLASTKNGKARKITPASFVMELLRRQRSQQSEQRLRVGQAWNNLNLVFSDPFGGYMMPHVVYDSFKKLVAELGHPEIRFHDLRHSYAVAAIKSGDDIKTVQGNLGHATASFTLDVYGHVTDQMKQESAQRMENFIKSIIG